VIVEQFIEWLLEFPFAVMGLAVTLTGWRAYGLWKSILASQNDQDKKIFCAKYLALVVLDIVSIVKEKCGFQ
jgi:hypothetical protein